MIATSAVPIVDRLRSDYMLIEALADPAAIRPVTEPSRP